MRASLTLLRPHRFEILAVAFGAAVWIVMALGVATRLVAFGIPDGCFSLDKPPVCDSLRPSLAAYFDTVGTWNVPVFVGLALVPPLVGLFLGIALVGKEIDQRTTVLAWSFSSSRVRWLATRTVPVALVVGVLGLAVGGIADGLFWLFGHVDPSRSFEGFGIRGVDAAAIGTSAFGIALVAGAVIGRVLPALLVAAALVAGSTFGVVGVGEAFLHTEVVLVDQHGWDGDGRIVDSRIGTPGGEVITLEEAYERYGDEVQQAGYPGSDLRALLLVNPGAIYPPAAWRMAVLDFALGLAAITLAFAVVDRRRP